MFWFWVVSILIGLGCLGRWGYLQYKQKQEQEKGFVVIAASLFLLWLCPGIGFVVLGIVIGLFLLFSLLF
ncbi:MAG: hypothetical protein DWQ19_11190 [Crenarchaeota archaeon]|nr:MAG: hypothetical protein DWQ19_11190 [Thermoproteota archaeon]